MNYTLLKTIGRGSYGQVFKAKCNATGETVAIKFIKFNEKNK